LNRPSKIARVDLRNFLIQNINNTNGQLAQERGASQPVSTRTFRELSLIQQEADNRRSEQLDVLEDFLEDIARKMSLLIDEFADNNFFVKVIGQKTLQQLRAIGERPSGQQPNAQTIVGENQRVQGFSATTEDFGGLDSEFDIEVKAGSTVPLTRENKAEIYRFAIETGPAAGAVPGGPLMGAAARGLFKEFDLPDLEMALDDELQAQQQLQQQQSQQQAQVSQLDGAKKGADIQIQAEREADRKDQTRIKREELGLRRLELRIKELEVTLKAQQNGDRQERPRREQRR